jgi:hypothetical protein
MSLLPIAAATLRPAAAPTLRRTLVSSVLLTKEWDSYTAQQLRGEARKRRLPAFAYTSLPMTWNFS